ncbi:MAG: PepSY domain-containing protein [gamma proteobacterium symbiont of Bathyaustriella thionipta]|nr:PepSY domain-containing protein [gamma proteobacterium symbiont of Bathyaustriella thionipta]
MKLSRYLFGITLVFCSSALVFLTTAQAEQQGTNDAIMVTSAKISLEQALEIARNAVPGKAAKIEYSTDDGQAVWEIEMVSRNQNVHDIEINASTGKVIKQKIDKIDDDDD